jgi:hypothetical protein
LFGRDAEKVEDAIEVAVLDEEARGPTAAAESADVAVVALTTSVRDVPSSA